MVRTGFPESANGSTAVRTQSPCPRLGERARERGIDCASQAVFRHCRLVRSTNSRREVSANVFSVRPRRPASSPTAGRSGTANSPRRNSDPDDNCRTDVRSWKLVRAI
jgi:hypothetical protein